MRILFVSPFLPYPPVAGGHAQIWGWMKRLARRHELAFVGFYERESEAGNAAEVERLCAETRVRLRQPTPHAYSSFAQMPGWVSEYCCRALGTDVAAATERFQPDVVQFLSTNMAQYRPHVARVPAVVTALEISFVAQARRTGTLTGCERARAQLEWARMRRYETRVFRQSAHVVTMSASDSRVVCAVAPRAKVTAVSPGVDPEMLVPRPRSPRPGSVLYLGHMEHLPNLDGLLHLYQDIWPRVQSHCPEARLTVVGSGAREELARLAPQVLAAMEADASVEIAGFVPDLRAVMDEHAVQAAPLRLGGGVRNKVIEAMAAGLPTVTTARGAEGLAVRNEREVLLAEGPQAFAEALVRVLGEGELQARLSAAGRELAAREHNNDALAARLEQALLSAAGARA